MDWQEWQMTFAEDLQEPVCLYQADIDEEGGHALACAILVITGAFDNDEIGVGK